MKQKLIIGTLFCLIVFSSTPGTFAQESASVTDFDRANQLYKDEDFTEAQQEYEALIASGLNNASVHFNLGNCYFKQGLLGQAIASYSRAKRLAPRDPDIARNLEFVQSLQVDQIASDRKQSFTGQFYFGIRDSLTLREIFFALVVLFWITCLFFALRWWKSDRALFRQGFWIFLVLYLGMAFLCYSKYREVTTPQAVITVPSVSALSGPDQGTELFTINEGTTGVVRRSQDDWIQIALPNGLAGWIPEKDVEVI